MLGGLTTRGRCLLAAGIAAGVCALVLDERDLLRVAVFVVALPLVSAWLAGRTRHGLAAQRDVVPTRVPVDSEASVRVRVSGHGRLPLGGVLLEDEVPPALGDRPRFVLDRFPGRQGVDLEYTIRPALRGMHRIGPLRTRIGDPFGMSEFQQELGGTTRVVAVPHVVPLGDLPPGSGLGLGEDGSSRLRAGHGDDDVMVREYRHGDDMRRVHWKSTAHRGELMVRVEERPWHGGVTVLLDRRSAAHRGSGRSSSLEWAVSATASICSHLHRHGQQVRLVTADGAALAGGGDSSDGGHDERAVLDALAALQPATQRDLACDLDPGHGRELIAVLGAMSAGGVHELTRSRPPGVRSQALLLDAGRWNDAGDEDTDTASTARRLRAAGWTVVVVEEPTSSMAAVWGELCRAGRVTHPSGVS